MTYVCTFFSKLPGQYHGLIRFTWSCNLYQLMGNGCWAHFFFFFAKTVIYKLNPNSGILTYCSVDPVEESVIAQFQFW